MAAECVDASLSHFLRHGIDSGHDWLCISVCVTCSDSDFFLFLFMSIRIPLFAGGKKEQRKPTVFAIAYLDVSLGGDSFSHAVLSCWIRRLPPQP